MNGVGHLLATKLSEDPTNSVIGWAKERSEFQKRYTEITVDISSPENISSAVKWIFEHSTDKHIDVLINNAGLNRLAFLEDLPLEWWDDSFDVNVRGAMLCVKTLLPHLIAAKGTVLNIGSSAAHTPMRASAAYNASKAALDMLTRQMARELTTRHDITVFGINPNKLKGTPMSREVEQRVCEVRGWTPEYAEEYQKTALLAKEETDPKELVDFICYLLSKKERHKYLTGCVIPYGAQG